LAKKLEGEGLKELLVSSQDLVGRYVASDIVNEDTGEVYVEAGEELSLQAVETLESIGTAELPTLDVDGVTIGAYIRNTMVIDKNPSR
ncbi:hypothetical protein ABTM85_20530, partial [Acinetobacter baumannii]